MGEPDAFKILEVELIRGEVLVTFDDGRLFLYSAEALRTIGPKTSEIIDVNPDPPLEKGEQQKDRLWSALFHLLDR